MIGSNCMVGNSSVSIREASFLGVPAVNIGNRQTGRDRGPNIIDTGYAAEDILQAIKQHLSNGKYPSADLYGDGKSGPRIAEILAEQPLTVDKRLTY
jgi:UDP-N-acetylglucosamine 2-epimerase